MAIEVVVVGDAPLDDSLGALLHATREALVNAAKYARDSPISVYAEVEPDQVTVFVRDRGRVSTRPRCPKTGWVCDSRSWAG